MSAPRDTDPVDEMVAVIEAGEAGPDERLIYDLVTALGLSFDADGTPCFCVTPDAVYADRTVEHRPRCRLARLAIERHRVALSDSPSAPRETAAPAGLDVWPEGVECDCGDMFMSPEECVEHARDGHHRAARLSAAGQEPE